VNDASEPKIAPDPGVLLGFSPMRAVEIVNDLPVARACV
jgi:hypothetical protein